MAVPTLYVVDGFEHGLATATSGTGVYDTVAGSPAIVTSPARTGARALEISTSLAAEYVGYTWASGNRNVTASFYLRFASLPSADVRLVQFYTAGGNSHVIQYRIAANGGPCLAVNANGTISNISGSIAINNWYRVDVALNTSANPHVIKARVDGGTEASANNGLAAVDLSGMRLGTNLTSDVFTCYYDDWVISLAGATDYPIGAHYVEQLLPTGDGTHSIANANEFERTATGTDITNSTTDAYLLVDDATIDTTPTDYINQVGTGTSDYVEVTFANPATQADTPIDVRGYVAYMDGAATGTTTSGCDFYDTDTTYATLSTAVKAHADTGNTTIKTFANSAANSKLLTRPASGWNITKVNALRARVGYGDGTPDGYFSTVMAEVAMQPVTTQNYSINHTKANITFTGKTHIPRKAVKVRPAVKNITFTAGTHRLKRGFKISHVVKNITFTAGTAGSKKTLSISHAVKNVTFSAGTNRLKRGFRISHATKNVTFSAGTSVLRRGIKLRPTVKNITFSGGTNTLRKAVRYIHAKANVTFGAGTQTPRKGVKVRHVVKNITFTGGTHTLTYTPGTAGTAYSLNHSVKNITFGVGAPTPRRGIKLRPTVKNITFAAGTHTPRRGIRRVHTKANVTFAGGTHTLTYFDNSTPPTVSFRQDNHLYIDEFGTGEFQGVTFWGAKALPSTPARDEFGHRITSQPTNLWHILPGRHSRQVGYHSATKDITFAAGTHRFAKGRAIHHTAANISFAPGSSAYGMGATLTARASGPDGWDELGRTVFHPSTEFGALIAGLLDTRNTLDEFGHFVKERGFARIAFRPGVHTLDASHPYELDHATPNLTFGTGTTTMFRSASLLQTHYGYPGYANGYRPYGITFARGTPTMTTHIKFMGHKIHRKMPESWKAWNAW